MGQHGHPSALLEVVERVERSDDLDARHELLRPPDDLVCRTALFRKPERLDHHEAGAGGALGIDHLDMGSQQLLRGLARSQHRGVVGHAELRGENEADHAVAHRRCRLEGPGELFGRRP